jgi:hypothetical protein
MRLGTKDLTLLEPRSRLDAMTTGITPRTVAAARGTESNKLRRSF